MHLPSPETSADAAPAKRVRRQVAGEPFSHLIDDLRPLYGISRSAAYRLFADGKLTPRKICGRTLVLAADVRALIANAPAAPIRVRAAGNRGAA